MIIKKIFTFNFWLIIFFIICVNLYPQSSGDAQMARQYVLWIQQAINENKWNDAASAMPRASDFSGVSSDISYLNAVIKNYFGADRYLIIYDLDNAIETNRWVSYNETHALLLKAETQTALRDYSGAIASLDRIGSGGEAAGTVQMREDAAMLRLNAFRGMLSGFSPGYNLVQARPQFRSLVLQAMDRFPRDPRPLRVFLEYARNREPQMSALAESDINLLEYILRRLPFLLEADPELAWMAAPFMRDISEARRVLAAYRAGGIPNIQNRDFKPHPASIPAALNLGLIDDFAAAEELFSGSVSYNNPLPSIIVPDGNPVLDIGIIEETYRLLRSEEGRNFFTRKLLSFTGIIARDEDGDGYIDYSVYYHSGVIRHFSFDRDQNNIYDLIIEFDPDGGADFATYNLIGQSAPVIIDWERYPSVAQVIIDNGRKTLRGLNSNWNFSPDVLYLSSNEVFRFGPGDFQYAPVNFTRISGSGTLTGLLFPRPAWQYIDLSYRSLISFCSSFTRSSIEIEGATETIYMNRGVLLQAIETFNGQQVSVTEFERGLPVIQHIDLDLDGRMETIRRFRRPPQNYTWSDFLDYRGLIASSESDFRGDGRFKTMEVYQTDGSIVYYFDMDGSGSYNYTEVKR